MEHTVQFLTVKYHVSQAGNVTYPWFENIRNACTTFWSNERKECHSRANQLDYEKILS